MALLEPAELELLERLSLTTRARLWGALAGDHRARRFGSSLDFADHREYVPGDDFRRIDPALSARSDRLYLRLFEAEEDLSVDIVVDASASMDFGDPPKRVFAARLAAGLCHVALIQHDRVRLIAARADASASTRWFSARADTWEAMRWLEHQSARGGGAIPQVLHQPATAQITVVISDLLDPRWEESLRAAARPGETAVLHVLAPDELEPNLEGDLTLVDAETGGEVPMSVDARSLTAYRRRVGAWRDAVSGACSARSIAYTFARSDEDAVAILAARLRGERVAR